MRIVTYNLRYDSQPDNISVQKSLNSLEDPLQKPHFLAFSGKEQPWSKRRVLVAQQLLGEGIAVAGFQEALIRQVNDLAELFGSDWSWVGVGREDGIKSGEFCPIFFKKSEINLISHDSFWLSNTPFAPSKFPGASSFRVCTAAHFTSQLTAEKKQFTILNTHLDDWSDAQRKLGASMLLARARYEAVKTSSPVFITGDFNSPSSGKDSGAYDIITGAAPPVPIDPAFAAKYAVEPDQLPGFRMLDLRGEAPRRGVSATYATFTGFTAPSHTASWSRIDFVFGGSNKGWEALGQSVMANLSDDGLLASDHRPVFTDVSI
ncbi:hypothetical protein GALMADRAFT_231017 [Galerina marginata CBS 339.88]|uniref:Endonuclease/exonuclease/phosphatase domain-containing protein n=1 Tax=Galerina marginata (strain CBS 339.88) TaxID=685588 RepID=A0A067SCM6_GALM3|nr:hypothetical protein GALMADRAFT_231017 [Galerina marginata CBS 339.88]